MQPEQNYDYIYQTGPTADPNRKKRIIIGVIGLTMFIFVLIVAVILMLSGPDLRNQLGKITANQQEIVRVAELGQKNNKARSSTRSLAATSQIVASTHVVDMVALVDNKYGQPLLDTTIASAKNSSIDSKLDEAEMDNTLDETYGDIMKALFGQSNSYIKEQAAEIKDEETLRVLDSIYRDNTLIADSIE